MTTLLQDLHYGIRMLAKNPAFTVVAVVTLALGIGATTAIFSLISALLLRPLSAVRNPEQLVMLERSQKGFTGDDFSYPDYLDYRNRNRTLAESSQTVQRRSASATEPQNASLAASFPGTISRSSVFTPPSGA